LRDIAQPVSLADAEAAFAKHNRAEVETAQIEPPTKKPSLMTDSDDDRFEADKAEEEMIPQDQTLFPLFEDWELVRTHSTTQPPPNPASTNPVLKRITEKQGVRE
jgi:hypothetical protein